jgi:sugar phosphate isomerase/epimerase
MNDYTRSNPTSRRHFLKTMSAATAVFMVPSNLRFLKDERMGIVVHSYGLRWKSQQMSSTYPAFTNAIDMLDHCHDIGASGIQVGVGNWTPEFARRLRVRREKYGMYVEGSIGIPFTKDEVAAFEKEVIASKEAGVNVLRTVCTSGRRYEVFHSREEFESARGTALKALSFAEPVLRKHKVKLAIENHKDWRATELVELIKTIGSEWVGATLDFGNSIALMEDPMQVVQTLAPYAFTTHVKDMGLDEYSDGFLLSEVPLGKGVLDLAKIVATCKRHNPNITFNLEMITRDPLQIPCLTEDYWTTFQGIGGDDLARTLRLVRHHKYQGTLPTVTQLNGEEKLATEEDNILECLKFSSDKLGMK